MSPASLLHQPVRTPWPAMPQAALPLWIVCSNLGIGGAERLIAETVEQLATTQQLGLAVTVFVLEKRGAWSYLQDPPPSVKVISLAGLAEDQKLARIIEHMHENAADTAFTHTIGLDQLRRLWSSGIYTMPVIHNMPRAWSFPPGKLSPSSCPLLVCTAEATASLVRAEGSPIPTQVIRFELNRWFHAHEVEHLRRATRSLHAIGEDVVLLGMVGSFKLHKSYTVAVRVLHALRRAGCPARLMILGGWDHRHGAGKLAYLTAMQLALKLNVMHHIIALGSVTEPTAYFPAFDVFLNTSLYEAASVATMEAVRVGCPVVAADVGGQREIVPPGAGILITDRGNPQAYSQAILAIAASKPARVPPIIPPEKDAAAALWPLVQSFGKPSSSPANPEKCVAFITSNLNHGGPQTSLVNLLAGLAAPSRPHLIVLDEATNGFLVDRVAASEVEVWSAASLRSVTAKTASILEHLRRIGADTVCFWNCRAEVKLLLGKVLSATAYRLIDVSPGPMLFDELEAAEFFAKRIAFPLSAYLSRLDTLVHKYQAELPARFAEASITQQVIPNGIDTERDLAPSSETAPASRVMPSGFDPRYALVTTGRIVPDKDLEFLLRVLDRVRESVPRVSLTIVGGLDQRHIGYYRKIQGLVDSLGLNAHVSFAGAHPNVHAFLGEFRLFVMHSRRQGCPNASLEAMWAGLPIVANDDGGTREQVLDGVTGFLAETLDEDQFVDRINWLLNNPDASHEMGARARGHVAERFSQLEVSRQWRDLLYSGARGEQLQKPDSIPGKTYQI